MYNEMSLLVVAAYNISRSVVARLKNRIRSSSLLFNKEKKKKKRRRHFDYFEKARNYQKVLN